MPVGGRDVAQHEGLRRREDHVEVEAVDLVRVWDRVRVGVRARVGARVRVRVGARLGARVGVRDRGRARVRVSRPSGPGSSVSICSARPALKLACEIWTRYGRDVGEI